MSLDESTANERYTLIRQGSITYQFSLVLTPTQYYGLAELNFYLENIAFDRLKVDFAPNTMEEVVVNAVNLFPESTKNFILIPKSYLQKGRNKIIFMYTNLYDKDRTGCITFFDKEQQYIYTDFQPYAAHRVFPCFDQPNLKASMKLTITAPVDWTVVSNQPVQNIQKLGLHPIKQSNLCSDSRLSALFSKLIEQASADTQTTTFGYTQPISTYLYAFAAGPYQWIETPEAAGVVPMRFYCVDSAIYLLEVYNDFMVQVTQKLMAFYQSFFGQPYPFRKFDQVFVRYYDSEGMENPGLVTMDELLMIQRYPSDSQYFYIAYQIAHELLHHWLGDLVTMNWWSDLWLNESFADFMAYLALEKINGSLTRNIISTGIRFRNQKVEAYRYDYKSISTHPVRSNVQNTDIADNIFDSITYMKGACALKQLVLILGQDKFSRAMKTYVDRFKWSNSEIDDVIQDIEPQFPSSLSLSDWVNDWLKTPSINVFESKWDPYDTSSSATLTIYQSSLSTLWDVRRYHQFQVAFLDSNAQIVSMQGVVIPRGAAEVAVTYDGSKQIKAILLNSKDESYLKNRLDPQSFIFFKQNILNIRDDFTRALVWYNIGELCQQSLMRVDDYTSFVMLNIFNEPLLYLIDNILSLLLGYMEEYLSDEDIVIQGSIVFDRIYFQLQNDPSDEQRNQVLVKHLINFAQTDEQTLKLKQFLMGEDENISSQIIIDEDLPWQIVKKVFALNGYLSKDEKEQVFRYVNDTDKSYRADAARIVCATILLDTAEQLEGVYEQLKSDLVDLTTKRYLAEGWKNGYHSDIVSTFKTRYFQDIVALRQELSYNFFRFFYQELMPNDSKESLISSYNNVINILKQDPTQTAHVANLQGMVEEMSLALNVSNFNFDSNLTLTQVRAIQRSNYIVRESISYISHIGFIGLSSNSTYSGFTEITFELSQVPELLPLDFICASLHKLVVNGYNVTPLLNGEFLLIPRIYLVLGQNNVVVSYQSNFNNDGLGCMSFVDTTATPSQDYIYTKFEPNGAHRFMPCFDQPDLKAKAIFCIILPSNWIASGNQNYNYVGKYNQSEYILRAPHLNEDLLISEFLNGKSGNFYVFDQTKLLPTYLYCIVAGQYYTVSLPISQRYNNIPMTLYSISSYRDALNLNADFIFEITKLSVKFYEGKFKVPYQFSKYDSVFCHEFASGAMENPGIITFNDTYLYQEVVSIDKMVQLGLTISHQCAHNWFGDYVTMKWWDDLWLNQSFADFMAYYCIDGIKDQVTTIPQYTSGWVPAISRVVGGYREDQLSTTHPIRSQVPNTSLATAYFDSITYRKGLSALKQLMFIMGENNFMQGVTAYFNQFGWSNGTIDDFLGQMEPFFTSPTPDYTLQVWKEMWLLTASLNVLTIDWNPQSSGPNATLTVTQTPFSQDFPTLRYHMINVAFFRSDGSYTTQKVFINNVEKTTVTYNASDKIKAILLNEGHQGYVKCVIDDNSLSFFQQNINSINKGLVAEDSLSRMIIWFYMNEMVRDARIKVGPYKYIIWQLIPNQVEDTIYNFELGFLNEATGSFIPLTARPQQRGGIFNFVMQQLNSKKSKSFPLKRLEYNKEKRMRLLTDQENRIKILKDFLPIFCSNEDQIDILNSWRLGTNADLINYLISPSQAWAVVKLVFTSIRYDLPQQTAIYYDQAQKTPGIAAQLTYNTVMALSATDTELEMIYETFKGTSLSVNAKMSYSEGWNNVIHLDLLTSKYYPKFFQDIPLVSKTLPNKHFEFFYTNLKPIDDNLSGAIAAFSEISLPDSNMLGHRNNIRKIVDTYKLRQVLYDFNSQS